MSDHADVDEPAAKVEHHPNGFHSGGGHPFDDQRQYEPDPGDPSQWCYECGNERVGMCGVCGMPLCGRHLELGAGFCSDRVTVDTRVGPVSACIRTLAGEREVAVDAPRFNYTRPQRARLPPDEIERAVRARLPDALIEQATGAVDDGLQELKTDYQFPDSELVESLLAISDGLRFAVAADRADRRDGWLEQSAAALAKTVDYLDETQRSVGIHLNLAADRLEQLGVDVDAGDDGGDPLEQ